MKNLVSTSVFIAFLGLASALSVRGQWMTQSFQLKSGWNAVYLHVDATHATVDDLVGADNSNPIEEIWLWKPQPSAQQFVDSPQTPTAGSTWASWSRSGAALELQYLIGNAAYLVRVSTNVASYTWQLKGRPVPPQYQWTTTGLNFLGFPTAASNPPDFERFLQKAPDLQHAVSIFGYQGGPLGETNPAAIFGLRTRPVNRGEAFWLRSGNYFNRYFAPFEVSLEATSGVNFGDSAGQIRLRVRNLIAEPLTVSLNLLPSEAPPAGQSPILAPPPILVRGELNTTNLTYPAASLNTAPQSWTLKAAGTTGSEVEIILGVNRFAMSGTFGDLYAAILQWTDSLGFSRVDIPVSARVASRAGLWIGDASVSQVRHYLKNYERDAAGQPTTSPSGQYIVSAVNTNFGAVAQPYPLRLIIHSDVTGTNASLLQRVYYGLHGTNLILATRESLLDSGQLATARRLSAVHLPWRTENAPWAFAGQLGQGSSINTVVNLAYDEQASNPFLHTYHPDHDNLDATFSQALPQGVESYGLSRQITLTFSAPSGDFNGLTGGAQSLSGGYEEAITILARGSESRRFDIRGAFSLTRLSDVSTLIKP